jgi:outer membrane protein assembly factor BamE (lipoprotein component of BamABCDE complex)
MNVIKKLVTGLFSGLIAAAFSACDGLALQDLKPGVSTDRDVRNRMGRPNMEWKDADGTQTWEYPRTPEGIVNYMIVIGPDNVLREVRQVLTEENFSKVKESMSKEEVRRLLGQPAHELYFSLKKEHVWDWKTKSESSMDFFFNVHFDDNGLVVKTSSNFVPKG